MAAGLKLGMLWSSRTSTPNCDAAGRRGVHRTGAPERCCFRESSRVRNDTEIPFAVVVCVINGSDTASGAQTERRDGAGSVRGLLGGKDPTGRFCSSHQIITAILLNRQLASCLA